MPKHIVLFGELLLRLDPEGFSRLVQADRFQVRYTGGEANVGAALVGWGHDARMVSRVPAHEIGQACVNYMRRFGIDTRHVQRAGDRLGLFYAETGASHRSSKVIYDRANSAFASFSDEALDWAEVFDGAGWFHFTGTAPAVGTQLGPVIKRACVVAKAHGVPISCDMNYRQKLWTREAAGATMSDLLPFVGLFVCGVDDAAGLFGIQPSERNLSEANAAVAVAKLLCERFGFAHVAVPIRKSSSATSNDYVAMLYSGGETALSKSYVITHIVDRIGAGDAMTAGLIHGISCGWRPQQTVDFAVAAACLKHTIPGDFNAVSVEEVQALAAGDGSGRIQR